jgi:lipid II:glycine glycyltransferase (peptidoglycan interpeptide bridge formation enzyme)
MDLRVITEADKTAYNQIVTHAMQSWEWGEFRKSFGLPLLRFGLFKNEQLKIAFQLTLHKIPLTNQFVGYLPKGPLPDKQLAEALEKIGIENHCAFIKVEPNIEDIDTLYKVYPKFVPSPKPLFTRHNFVIDLTLPEEQLLKNMHQKTRYNIRVAEKKGVKIEVKDDDETFKKYLKLHFETANRQGFYSHNQIYHQTLWKMLKESGMVKIVTATYQKKLLSAWFLVIFKDTIYYVYGASSIEHKEVMANNLVAWEGIKLGQSLGLKTFDMWGALGPKAPDNDPWMGFHRFKQGYGGRLVTYLGSYDLVFNDPLYWAFTTIDKLTGLKVFLLKLIGK